MVTRRHVASGLVALFVLQFASISIADDRTAAALLPETTVLYAELPKPAALVDLLETHPLRKQIESLDGIREALAGKQYLQFKAVVSVIEANLGRTWQKIIKDAAAGGIAVGLDAPTQGLGILVKSQSEETLPQIISSLVELARADAASKGNPDPVKSADYRDITAYQVEKVKVAAFGPWLLVTNKPEFGKAVIDSYLDKPEKSLAASEQFQAARSVAPDNATAWAYVNVEALRKGGIAKDLFKGQTDNPVAEIIFGGLLDTLKQTPHATAALVMDKNRVRFELAAPHKNEWVSEARQYFFGPEGKGAAPALLSVKNELLSLSTYRDFSTMWLRAGDLFDEKVNDGFAQADANLSTFFSGKDFGEEVLGAMQPEVQLVVARQTFADNQPQPAIKVPSFALVFRLKDPETMKPDFRRTFTSLIGFLNVIGAMNGQPQLDLDIDKNEDRQIVTASYLPDKAGATRAGLKIYYNFSPSVAFVGDHFIVSSTKELVGELLDVVDHEAAPREPVNTAMRTNLSGVHDILADNRGQLVAQNMIGEGHTKAEAEHEIDVLLQLISMLRDASLEMKTSNDTIRVTFELSLAAPQ